MTQIAPPHGEDVRKIVDERVEAVEAQKGLADTLSVEWRGGQITIPVISMPIDQLSYNPGTHRIRAQRSLDPARDRDLTDNPFGADAQGYLHELLQADPSDPGRIDPAFTALKADLAEHGQTEPGIITRLGLMINGNTRRAALRELKQPYIRVGVLGSDARIDDLQTIELSLQLRQDHRRDYSFMNLLLAIDERVNAGWAPEKIQREFRIKPVTFERNRWILVLVREAIARSARPGVGSEQLSMRLVDFETHKGKLDELYTAYTTLKAKSPDDAEALREQRLLAIALDKSKTDIRWIEADFTEHYMSSVLPSGDVAVAAPVTIPGTSIKAPGPSQAVEKLRTLTTEVLRARSVELAPGEAPPALVTEVSASLGEVRSALDRALDQAGRSGRVVKRRFAPAERISDAAEDLALSVSAIAEARATGNFDSEDLDDALTGLRTQMVRLAQAAARDGASEASGLQWLVAVASLPAMGA
jgi:hypothetical protein